MNHTRKLTSCVCRAAHSARIVRMGMCVAPKCGVAIGLHGTMWRAGLNGETKKQGRWREALLHETHSISWVEIAKLYTAASVHLSTPETNNGNVTTEASSMGCPCFGQATILGAHVPPRCTCVRCRACRIYIAAAPHAWCPSDAPVRNRHHLRDCAP